LLRLPGGNAQIIALSALTAALLAIIICNGDYGPARGWIPNTDYLHVFHSGSLRLAVNTPNGTYSWGAFHVGVVALP
jgi:hypothetical protein